MNIGCSSTTTLEGQASIDNWCMDSFWTNLCFVKDLINSHLIHFKVLHFYSFALLTEQQLVVVIESIVINEQQSDKVKTHDRNASSVRWGTRCFLVKWVLKKEPEHGWISNFQELVDQNANCCLNTNVFAGCGPSVWPFSLYSSSVAYSYPGQVMAVTWVIVWKLDL